MRVSHQTTLIVYYKTKEITLTGLVIVVGAGLMLEIYRTDSCFLWGKAVTTRL